MEEAEFKLWQTGCLIPRVWLLVGLRRAFFFLVGKWMGNRERIAHFLDKVPKLQASEKLQKRLLVWKLNFSQTSSTGHALQSLSDMGLLHTLLP